MKTNANNHETKTAKVVFSYDGTSRSVEYSEISDMMEKISDTVEEYLDEEVLFFSVTETVNGTAKSAEEMAKRETDRKLKHITVLAEGKEFFWNDTVAHYCFYKGRIDNETAFEIMAENR